MTTTTETTPTSDAGAAKRILNVVRLHLANKQPIIVLPLLILAFIFLINLAVWWLVLSVTNDADSGAGAPEIQISGASSFIFIYMLVVAVQAVNLTFPFALGYSVTRQEFYLGSSLTFVLLSAFYAAIMTIMGLIERATGGWGFGAAMFDVVPLRADNPLLQFVQVFVIFLFFFFIGAATSSVYVRWRGNGLLVFFASLTIIIVGFIALITYTESWPAVGSWFATNGVLGVVMWSLLPTALCAMAGYALLRKATPRH